MKKSVVKSQFLRALKVSSDPISAKSSTRMIHDLFRSNSYPSRWLDGVAHQAMKQHNKNTSTENHNKNPSKPSRGDRMYICGPPFH